MDACSKKEKIFDASNNSSEVRTVGTNVLCIVASKSNLIQCTKRNVPWQKFLYFWLTFYSECYWKCEQGLYKVGEDKFVNEAPCFWEFFKSLAMFQNRQPNAQRSWAASFRSTMYIQGTNNLLLYTSQMNFSMGVKGSVFFVGMFY
jgi:hypothetical protein